MRRMLPCLFAGILATTPALAGPGHLVASVDLERGGPIDLDAGIPSTGAGVRVGYGFDLGLVELIPEARVMIWGEEGTALRSGTLEAGGRVMFLKILEPGVYARAVAPIEDPRGPGVHAGAMLDFTAIPALDLGLHGGALVSTKEGPGWVAGAHLTVNI